MGTTGAGLAGLFGGGKGIGMVVALVAISAVGTTTAAGMLWHPGGVPAHGTSGVVGSMECQARGIMGSLKNAFSGAATCQLSASGGMMSGGSMNGRMSSNFMCTTSGIGHMNGTPVTCRMNGPYSMENGMTSMSGNYSGSLQGMMSPQYNNITGTMSCQMTMSGMGSGNGGMGGMMSGRGQAPYGNMGGQMTITMSLSAPVGGSGQS